MNDTIQPDMLASLVHASPDILYLFRLDRGEYAFVSRPGPLPRQVQGATTPEAALHPQDAPALERHFHLVSASGTNAFFEVEYRMIQDGAEHWFCLRESVFEREHGTPLSVLGIVQDITARKTSEVIRQDSEHLLRAVRETTPEGILGVAHEITTRIRVEQELRESEARLAEAQAVARIGSWATDLNTFQVRWSDETFRIFALDKETFSPSHEAFLGFVHPEDRAAVDEAFRDSFKREAYNAIEHRIIAHDGSIKFIEERWRIYRDREGRPARAVGTCQDISERRLAQEALSRAEKLESVGVLAAGIAHDFNNLMGGLFGYIDLARETLPNAERVRSYLDRAMEALDRARALTRQLLTFARGNAPEKTTGSIVPVLVNNTRFVLSGSNVAPSFHLDDNLWLCDFDAGQMGQVIDNLVINAMQAMPRGGTLTVTARNASVESGHALKPGRYIQISVADQGPGIPESIRGRIFDPFFTTKPSGNGLGLATAYSIVKKHEGVLEVESSKSGSVFHIYLPATESAAPQARVDPHRPHSGAGKILIMDDEPYIREIAAAMLGAMGYSTEQCASGEGALEMIADPVMADPQGSGFNAGISKPFRKAELEAMLSRHLPAVK